MRWLWLWGVAIALAQQSWHLGVGIQGHSGIALTNFGNLRNDLNKPDLLQQDSIDFYTSPWTSNFGISLEVLLFRWVALRGGFQWWFSDASETAKGQMKMNTQQLGGSIAILIWNKTPWLLYPYVGYWSGTSQMRITNYHTEILYFGDVPIDRNNTEIFTTSDNRLEIGIGGRFIKKEKFSYTIGAELGAFFNNSAGKWKYKGNEVPQVSAPKFSGGYLRVSFGFGYYKKKTTEATEPVSKEEKVKIKKKKKKEDDLFE